MLSHYNHLKKIIITILFLVVIFLCLPTVCGHGHSHDHAHEHEEAPSFKYSRQANEEKEKHADHLNTQNENTHERLKSTPNPNLWFEALGATFLISLAPYMILFFIPVTNTKEHEPYLKILLAFASGGLLGDAFLHLIPHALLAHEELKGSHSHSHSHSHSEDEEGTHSHDTTIGMSVLCGIITFLVVEKFVRIFKGDHSHSHIDNKPQESKSKKENNQDKKNKSKKTSKDSTGSMKVAGYLNLAADFTHNFTDGLAIGASFLAGRTVGIVTTFTILLHEVPHEIGDFAILLQSGCSRRKAMALQLITAVGALSGTTVSLMVEGADDSSVSWILPFTAGGFIYIATVSVIPELLHNTKFWQSVKEVSAMLLGVALMLAITWVEELGHLG